MYDLEQVFQSLSQVLDLNFTSKTKDFWLIYFHWWRFFYCFNENIEKSKTLEEKILIIEKFMQYNKALSATESAMLERYRVNKNALPAVEEIPFAPHIQNMKELFKKEQERFGLLMRGVKKQKAPIKKVAPKRGHSKQKWLRT